MRGYPSGKIYLAGQWEETAEQTTPEQMDDAIAAAVEAFAETRVLPHTERAKILTTIANGIEGRAAAIAASITTETGKVIRDARREVERAIATFRAAAVAAPLLAEIHPLDPHDSTKQGFWHYVPLGPIAAITPFNFPINLIAHKVAPAMAAGDPIIVKPAPQAPTAALLLAEIIDTTAWPKGGLSVLPCSNDVAERLVTDDRMRLLTFTGSAAVGWRLKTMAGQKRVALELGGNAAAIVCADADVDRAVKSLTLGAFGNAGQSCISTQRLFVARSIFDRVVTQLVARARALTGGDPSAETTDVGPLISEAAAVRVEEWLGEAVARGAHVLCGGKRHGAFFPPTVVVDANDDLKINREEIFAPVITVAPFDDFSQALASANHSPYGLAAAVWTKDKKRQQQAISELEVGQIIFNETTSLRYDAMPYGGVKASGLGREGPAFAMVEMSEIQVVIQS